MKFTLVIDPQREPEVVVYAHESSALTQQIEQLVQQNAQILYGYDGQTTQRLQPEEIQCFVAQDNRVFAHTAQKVWQVRQQLYQLEEGYAAHFVRINRSCLVSVAHIRRFDAGFSGALRVTMNNGYTDYVSRRQIRAVKERMGIKR